MRRHLTVSGFVVEGERTLLHWHRKNQMWLPPGGHVEADEDPVQAVLREVLEETGFTVEVVRHAAPLAFDEPAQLPAPYAILVEDIAEGPHQHIDCIYFTRPVAGVSRLERTEDAFVWVAKDQLTRDEALPVASCGADLPVPADVRLLALAAIAHAGHGRP